MPIHHSNGEAGVQDILKLMGVGETEQHWTVTKCNMSGKRAKLGKKKNKKQAAIAAACSHEKSTLHRTSVQKVGKLYEEKDFAQFYGRGLSEERIWFPSHCSGHGIRTGRPCR
jgi:uncharacterized small protein (DUF1192 family)